MGWTTITAADTDSEGAFDQTLWDNVRNNLESMAGHGYSKIFLLPSDFITGNAANPSYFDNLGRYVTTAAGSLIATVPIPEGFKATKVIVYGDDEADVVEIYECELDDALTATISLVNGNIEADTGNTTNEINITDVNSTSLNYLSIKVTDDAGLLIVYGGWVTIELI